MKQLYVACKLREIAELLELLGENSFKVRAYRQAATSLEQLTTDLERIFERGKLSEISGVGKSISAQIEEILINGDTSYLKELRQRAPFSELLNIPGVGPKMARGIYESLRISTIAELKAALESQKIREVPGMTSRTERNLIRGIGQLTGEDGKTLLGIALPVAREIIGRLQMVPGVLDIQLVGSTRRYRETVSDVDLLVKTKQPEELIRVATTMWECREVLEKNNTKAIILTHQGIKLEILTVTAEDFPLKLFMTTGKEHVKQVEELLIKQGVKCYDDYWLDKNGKRMLFSSEKEIYQMLGMDYVIPELREGTGEVKAALEGWIPQSVCLNQLKGDLHTHTRWSDGVNSIDEMVVKARSLGYEYLAICDHSRSLKIAKGMTTEMLLEQMKVIDDLNSKIDDLYILKGIEVDILKDGSLDYPDEILSKLDIVIASIHTGFSGSKEDLTKRVIRAIENPYVDILAHPTGRLIQRRDCYEIDIEGVILAAKKTGTVLELNATPDRLDLCDSHLKLCKTHGVKIAINSDAHSIGQMEYMEYGVGTARRGWIEKQDVINTYSLPELMDFLDIKK